MVPADARPVAAERRARERVVLALRMRTMTARRFELHRDQDISGVSGVGIVAEGVAFTDGTVALRWLGSWPTSVVFHDRGIEAVDHIHGHSGATRIVWLDEPR